MAMYNRVNVLEHCKICPPPGTIVNQSLPLTFFDIWWIPLHPMQHLIFYEFHHSKSHFIETIIPNLKHSLSLALKYFFPLAGNLVLSLNSSMPEILYSDGDSIPLTCVECSCDFDYLTGHHARNADEFYPLVPKLPSVSMLSNSVLVPILAIQVTLFPNSGLCIGFAIRHSVVDGGCFHNFIKTWASIAKFEGDAALLESRELSLFDRTMIKDPNGHATEYWTNIREKRFYLCELQILPTNKMRAAFVIGRADVKKLKEWVVAQCPTLSHVSTFTVACAYTWVTWIKARSQTGEEATEEKLARFVFLAECRARLGQPLPKTYFGNCLAAYFVTTKSTLLVVENGFLVAAKLIGEAITKKLHNEVGIFKVSEALLSDLEQGDTLFVSGSPKFSVYEIDFGWGMPKKNEIVSIDATGDMSLSESRDGGVEIGLSLPKATMDAFAVFFADGLKVQKG